MRTVDESVLPERLAELEALLVREIEGDVCFDLWTRMLYSTDASIYRITPLGVVFPRSEADVATVVEGCHERGLPVLPRGGGTSLAGQTVGEAVVLDFSRYLHASAPLEPGAGSIAVEPGIYLDHVNDRTASAGLMFGPDPASGNRATVGGVIGNNGTGAHSILYGHAGDHLRSVQVVLADGTRTRFEAVSWREAHRRAGLGDPDDVAATSGGRAAAPPPVTLEEGIYREVLRILKDHHASIQQGYPRHWRRVGGYDLKGFTPGQPLNLARLIAGSEGTLATVTGLELDLVDVPPGRSLAVLSFDDLLTALGTVPAMLAEEPTAIELMDAMLMGLCRRQPEWARRMTFVEGEPAAVLAVEVYGESEAERTAHLERLVSAARMASPRDVGALLLHDAASQQNVWTVRKAGLGLLMSTRGDHKPIPFVEDTAVPPESLRDYIADVLEVFSSHDTPAAFYAHASAGCLHIRPLVNLKDAAGIDTLASISEAVSDLVLAYGGNMCGEHGDGLARSALNEKIYGAGIVGLFERVKDAFDPRGIMNPGKIVRAPAPTESLRFGTGYVTRPVTTYFDFSADGGFARAVEMCNGSGECRKLETGTMCPSYMATRDEEHSTRGRANALRAVLSGAVEADGLADERLHETLDLCLECKSCTTECPSSVDMTRLKTEFLAHYHEAHGTPLRTRLFGHFDTLSRLGSATAPVSNWIASSAPVRVLLDRGLAIDRRHSLPVFARRSFVRRFRQWQKKRGPDEVGVEAGAAPGKVWLLPDAFTNYTDPGTGMAAVVILQAAGFTVDLLPLPGSTCGRAMLSKGLLPQARSAIRANLEAWAPLITDGSPILGIEPSSLLTLRDEYPALVPGEAAAAVREAAWLVLEWLAARAAEVRRRLPFRTPRDYDEAHLYLHGHCHEKALAGTDHIHQVLGWLPETGLEEIDSGCCGMAGSFGWEKEHYEISMAVGSDRLFPAIRELAGRGTIVAPGISCRHQIFDATGRRACHPLEVLAARLIE